MKVAVVFIVIATVLLTFFGFAAVLGPPLTADSRNLFVLGVGAAGLVFAALAFRRFRTTYHARQGTQTARA